MKGRQPFLGVVAAVAVLAGCGWLPDVRPTATTGSYGIWVPPPGGDPWPTVRDVRDVLGSNGYSLVRQDAPGGRIGWVEGRLQDPRILVLGADGDPAIIQVGIAKAAGGSPELNDVLVFFPDGDRAVILELVAETTELALAAGVFDVVDERRELSDGRAQATWSRPALPAIDSIYVLLEPAATGP